jgi:uncharacterized protein YifN (PemK superfamily)
VWYLRSLKNSRVHVYPNFTKNHAIILTMLNYKMFERIVVLTYCEHSTGKLSLALLHHIVIQLVSKFNFFVCRLVKTVSRAVHKTSCSLHALARRQPVHNETFIDRSIIKWVQCAWVSTMNFQSSFLNFLLNIYGVPFIQFWFQIKFTQITGGL